MELYREMELLLVLVKRLLSAPSLYEALSSWHPLLYSVLKAMRVPLIHMEKLKFGEPRKYAPRPTVTEQEKWDFVFHFSESKSRVLYATTQHV